MLYCQWVWLLEVKASNKGSVSLKKKKKLSNINWNILHKFNSYTQKELFSFLFVLASV